MNRLVRMLMGLSVIAGLAPVVSFAATGQWNAWLDPGRDQPAPMLAVSQMEELTEPNWTLAGDAGYTATHHDHSETSLIPEDSLTGVSDSSEPPATQPDSNPSTKPSESTGAADSSTDRRNATTTTTTSRTSSSPPAVVTDDEITGDACPCTVQGIATLKETVNLRGDLIVDGGTLVARPGVTVNGNGFQIMFMDGGNADFQGSETSTWSGNGSKQNLNRDIVFKNLRRIMFHQGAGKSTLRYFSVVDSGGAALGDYPIHFHLNGNTTRGTLVEGVVVLNGKHHAFVPHGSHGITFRDTIAKNTRGEAYWWDPADTNCSHRDVSQCTMNNSNDIVYDHALADGVFNGPGDNRGFQLNAFRLGAGSGNKVFDSAAINVKPSHKDVCSGFHWPADANQNKGGNVWLFRNNHGESDCNGIYVWQNDGNHHIVDGFSGGGIEHGAYGNNYEYRNVNVPFLIIHATQWKISNSSIGVIEVRDHVAAGEVTLTNVSGTKVVLNDGHGDVGAHLIFSGSNLTCSDVDWADPHPDTQVVIDGQSC